MPLSVRPAKSRCAGAVGKGKAADYSRQFALFVNSTDEKKQQIETILGILRRLKRKEDFLDVGAGSGEITAAVSEWFGRTTVIEPSADQVRRLSRRFPGFRIFPDTVDGADLGDEKFDLVLCSHVLYYIPEARWGSVVDGLFFRLREEGKMVVALQSSEGDTADFFSYFTGNRVGSMGLWRRMAERYGQENVLAHYRVSRVQTTSLDDMTDIGLFMLVDKKYSKKRSAIRRYFETRHKAADGYSMRIDSITFEITKPSLAGDARF